MIKKEFCKFEYGFSKEIEMLVKINELLDDELVLIKTANKYCCVDFELTNDNKLVCYIELKSRRNIANFNDLMIGETKLYNISKLEQRSDDTKHSKKTILLWIDGETYYYCYFDEKFLKYRNGYCGGSAVIYIPKTDMTIADINSFVILLNSDYSNI